VRRGRKAADLKKRWPSCRRKKPLACPAFFVGPSRKKFVLPMEVAGKPGVDYKEVDDLTIESFGINRGDDVKYSEV
jgi:hypothetical protein